MCGGQTDKAEASVTSGCGQSSKCRPEYFIEVAAANWAHSSPVQRDIECRT